MGKQPTSMSGATEFETVDTSSGDHTFSNGIRGLYIGVSGTVVLETEDGNQHTFLAMAAGFFHPIAQLKKIIKTGTTATNIKGAF